MSDERDFTAPAAAAGERPAQLQPGSRKAADTAGVPVTADQVQGPTDERPAGVVATVRSSWAQTEDAILRRELLAILRELGRRRYGETMKSAGGWSILTVPLQWALPPPDPYTQAQVRIDEHRARIIANGTHVSTEMSDNDVYCLMEWLGAIYTSGAWPMGRPAWPVGGSGDVR